jgi:hypothetical protein
MKTRKRNRRTTRRMFAENLEDRRLLAAAPHPLDLSTLDGDNGFRLDGVVIGNGLGAIDVSRAGDLNDDGFDDVVTGTEFGPPEGPDGNAFVVFGSENGVSPSLDLNTLDGTNGFRLDGSSGTGASVDSAGDFNGDGIEDLIIGSTGADFNGTNAGAAYVLFGSSAGFPAAVDLDSLNGIDGFRLDGVATRDSAGYAVSGAGDVNGDGLADIVIGARPPSFLNGSAGMSHVVFGTSSSIAPVVQLAALDGSTGFRLEGVATEEGAGRAVSDAGDVNGDGFDDLLIGATNADNAGPTSGSAYVFFEHGGAFAAVANLADLDGSNGFRLDGIAPYEASASSVSGAGDLNGDGLDDIVIGTAQAAQNGEESGSAYIFFGRTSGFDSSVSLASLDGTNGFRVDGIAMNDHLGGSVSGAGDFNDDGFDDLLIGAWAVSESDDDAGASYLLFGTAGGFGATLDLATIDGNNGFRMDGFGVGNLSGRSVSGEAISRVIEGLDGTLINGQQRQTFHGERIDRLVINTGAGRDVVMLDEIFGGRMEVDTGAGKDFVEMDYGDYQSASLELETGNGDDHVVLIGSHNLAYSVIGTWVTTGRGNDRVEQRGNLGNGVFVELGVGDDVMQSDVDFFSPGPTYSFDGGSGFDRLTSTGNFGTPTNFEQQSVRPSSDYFFGGDVTTEVIADPNIGNFLVIKGKTHFDHDLRLSSLALGQVTVQSTGYDATIDGVAAPASFDNIARVKVVTGSGTDTVLAEGLLISDKLIVNTGLGDDAVKVLGSQLEKLKINTGGGEDSVLIDNTTIDRQTNIFTGWSADRVDIHNSVFGRKAKLFGGLDDDTLELIANDFAKGLEHNFETVL